MSSRSREPIASRPKRFQEYPEYRDSGIESVGRIPVSWHSLRLRYLAQINPTKRDIRGLNPELLVSFIPMEAVGEYGGFGLEISRSLGTMTDGYTYFRDNDVVIAKITPCFENGKGGLAQGLLNGIAFGTTELHILRPEPEVDPRFLFYVTISDRFRRTGASEMYGAAGQKRVPEDFIRNFRHPVPEIAEQRAIAAFLDQETGKIDSLIAKKEQLIELLQEKHTALITQAVTKGLDLNVPMKDSGVEWLGQIPAHWDLLPLKYCILAKSGAIKTGPFGSQLLAADMQGEDIKVYNQRTVIDRDFSEGDEYVSLQKFRELSTFEVFPGDVLVTTRGTIGRCAIIPENSGRAILHPCLMRIQPNPGSLLTEYLALIIEESDLIRTQLALASNAKTIEVIYSDTMRRILVPRPPLDEQAKTLSNISERTVKISALIKAVSEAINHLSEYRAALISEAVLGRIDVRGTR